MNLPKPRCRTESERDRRFAQRARDVLQTGRSVSNNREQAVEKKRRDRSANADSEKRQRHEQRQQRERRNGLHNSGKTENDVSNCTAAARPNPKRDSNQH